MTQDFPTATHEIVPDLMATCDTLKAERDTVLAFAIRARQLIKSILCDPDQDPDETREMLCCDCHGSGMYEVDREFTSPETVICLCDYGEARLWLKESAPLEGMVSDPFDPSTDARYTGSLDAPEYCDEEPADDPVSAGEEE